METTENRAGRVLEIPYSLSGCSKAGAALAVSLLTHLTNHCWLFLGLLVAIHTALCITGCSASTTLGSP